MNLTTLRRILRIYNLAIVSYLQEYKTKPLHSLVLLCHVTTLKLELKLGRSIEKNAQLI